jgi:3-phosphoshikimate 1-carboxyvinyltransferase
LNRTVRHSSRLEGTVVPPGDKSISHRAALLNAISDGDAVVSNFCVGDDRTSMLGCLRRKEEQEDNKYRSRRAGS